MHRWRALTVTLLRRTLRMLPSAADQEVWDSRHLCSAVETWNSNDDCRRIARTSSNSWATCRGDVTRYCPQAHPMLQSSCEVSSLDHELFHKEFVRISFRNWCCVGGPLWSNVRNVAGSSKCERQRKS